MGFGILLIGYFVTFAFSISSYYFFADIIGILIMLYAFSKLSRFNLYFVDAMVPGLVYLVLCAVNAAAMMFKLYPMDGTADLVVDILKTAAACVMHVFIFLGTVKGKPHKQCVFCGVCVIVFAKTAKNKAHFFIKIYCGKIA